MKAFMLTQESHPVAECAIFSNGTVVLSWLDTNVVSRFTDIDEVRRVLPTVDLEILTSEPLAGRLKEARLKSGLSQRALARLTGVSFSTISRIERGANHMVNDRLENWLRETSELEVAHEPAGRATGTQ